MKKIAAKYRAEDIAAYVCFSEGTFLESKYVSPGIVRYFDVAGHVFGMEFLQADCQSAPHLVNEAT